MDIVVLLELVEPLDALVLGIGDPVDAMSVRRVHAAPSDPDAPGDPGALTVCGTDTAAMVVDRWSPQRPGQGWYPPRWAGCLCPTPVMPAPAPSESGRSRRGPTGHPAGDRRGAARCRGRRAGRAGPR
nr:hypothetical protein KPHV_00990 [Kitasatospora purpeofusca]